MAGSQHVTASDTFSVELWEGFVGGMMIGSSIAIFLHMTGRVTGVSGFVADLLVPDRRNIGWKTTWVLGFGVVSAAVSLLEATHRMVTVPSDNPRQPTVLAMCLGGYLVGLGTKMGNGCTSGHGLCGLARLSPRSIVNVVSFLTCGMLLSTVVAVHRPSFLVTDNTLLPNEPTREIALSFLGGGFIFLLAIIALDKSDKAMVREHYITFFCGALFAVGLIFGGMGRIDVIQDFLNLGVGWNPQLAFVLGGGLFVSFPAFYLVKKRPKPTLKNKLWVVPTNTVITLRLVIGGCLFGMGWGLGGLCPGPAVMQSTIGNPSILAFFVPSMALGMWTDKFVDRFHVKRATGAPTLVKAVQQAPLEELQLAHMILSVAAAMATPGRHANKEALKSVATDTSSAAKLPLLDNGGDSKEGEGRSGPSHGSHGAKVVPAGGAEESPRHTIQTAGESRATTANGAAAPGSTHSNSANPLETHGSHPTPAYKTPPSSDGTLGWRMYARQTSTQALDIEDEDVPDLQPDKLEALNIGQTVVRFITLAEQRVSHAASDVIMARERLKRQFSVVPTYQHKKTLRGNTKSRMEKGGAVSGSGAKNTKKRAMMHRQMSRKFSEKGEVRKRLREERAMRPQFHVCDAWVGPVKADHDF